MNIETQQIAAVELHLLSIADFEPLKGQQFPILFSEQDRHEALLVEVLPLTGYTALERKPFSIVLQTSMQASYYPQAIYAIEHPALGAMEVFLVPLGLKNAGIQYEAVFS